MWIDLASHRKSRPVGWIVSRTNIVAVLTAALFCLHCGPGEDVPLEEKIDLVTRFQFAEIRTNAPGSSPNVSKTRQGEPSETGFFQAPDSAVLFGLAVPNGGRLRGTLSPLHEDRGATRAAEGHYKILLVDPMGQQTVLQEGTPNEPAELDIDLSPWVGQLVNLELRLRTKSPAKSASTHSYLWNNLRIDGELAPSTDAAPESAIPRAKYNILVIVLDSLRADHLTTYGARGIHTPNLLELTEKGVTFAAARSNSSWTRPSIATLFSSQYPWIHGVRRKKSILDDAVPYLPQILNRAGYRVEGASVNGMVSEPFGMDRGFEPLYPIYRSMQYRNLHDPIRRANWVWFQFLRSFLGSKTPYFGYLHLLDPHSPYSPGEQYRKRFVRLDLGNDFDTSDSAIGHMRRNPGKIADYQLEYMRALYKGEVALMDDYMGRIFDLLEENNMTEHTLVIFTSDHGEEFMDHGSLGHGHSVYEELLRVPFIMRLDGVLPAGLRIEDPVDMIDIAPTILDLLGQEIPETMQGKSLLPLIEAPESWEPRISLASSGRPVHHAIRYGRWKLIRKDPNDDQDDELYNLIRDPREATNIYADRTVIATALQQMLKWELYRAAHLDQAERVVESIDEETLRELEELGYVGD